MRPIRVSDVALDDVARQLGPEAVELFVRHDLRPAIAFLAEAIDWFAITNPDGPARRLTVDGITVAGYHLWVALDPSHPQADALAVYNIDIWTDGWPADEPA